jgi:hypothetical protein
MRTLAARRAWWPALRSVLPLAIALLVAACSPGGSGRPGY